MNATLPFNSNIIPGRTVVDLLRRRTSSIVQGTVRLHRLDAQVDSPGIPGLARCVEARNIDSASVPQYQDTGRNFVIFLAD